MPSLKSIDNPLGESIINEQLITSLTSKLYENKAEKIIVYSSGGKLLYADFVLICSATSITHNRALAKKIALFFKKKSIPSYTSSKKIDDSNWIVMDYGDVIIHLFCENTREKYNLEFIFKNLKIINQF